MFWSSGHSGRLPDYGRGRRSWEWNATLGADLKPRNLKFEFAIGIVGLGLALALVGGVAAGLGPAPIPYDAVIGVLLHRLGFAVAGFSPIDQQIIEQIRLPRVVAGALVGLALGAGGAVLQGLFRNPLADPGIIGVSSGGALGAVLAIATGFAAQSHLAVPLAAFAGALAVAFVVYGVGQGGPKGTLVTVILAGIAVGAFASAITSLAITMTEERERNRDILFWLMGGLDNRTWEHVQLAAFPILAGLVVCLAFGRDLNLMMMGEESARTLGVPVGAVRALLLAVVAGMTAAAVGVSGVINFVGLMVPHAVRLVVGYDHRLVVPFSGLAGAVFLVLADILARIVTQPAELRVGIVTSALGAPFFIYLILRERRDRPSL